LYGLPCARSTYRKKASALIPSTIGDLGKKATQ